MRVFSSAISQGWRSGSGSSKRMFENGSAQGLSSDTNPLSLLQTATAWTPPSSLFTVAGAIFFASGWRADQAMISGKVAERSAPERRMGIA